jgi:hypothetical protein
MAEAEIHRLTRWGIPGWVALLSFGIFLLVDAATVPIGQPKELYDLIISVGAGLSQVAVPVATIAVAVAGVPLGYLIYQLYFFLRWNSPFSAAGLGPPLISGRLEDLRRTTLDISDADLTGSIPWRARWLGYARSVAHHSWTWRYLELLFDEAAQKIDSTFSAGDNFARHRALLDRLHTIGASTIGLHAGFVAYALLKVSNPDTSFARYFLTSLVLTGVLVCLVALEDRRRRLSHDPTTSGPHSPSSDEMHLIRIPVGRGRSVSLGIVNPASMLILLMLFLHLFNNPFIEARPGKLAGIDLRPVVAGVIVVLWAGSLRTRRAGILVPETLLATLLPIIAAIPWVCSLSLPLPVDWPYFSALTAFIVVDMVFLKNYCNARDDVIALEHYTLRRYVTEHQHHPKGGRPKSH